MTSVGSRSRRFRFRPAAGVDVSPDLQRNLKAMTGVLGTSPDIIFREFTCGFRGVRPGLLVFIDGLAEGTMVQELLNAAVRFTNPPYEQPHVARDPIQDFKETVVQAIELRASQKVQDAVKGVLAGETALFLEGARHVLVVDTRWNPARNIEEPAVEAEIRGPRDGMVESIRLNTVLLRRRIRDPRLRMESMQIGRRTATDVCIVYIDGLADPGVVREVRRRLQRIELDSVLGSSYLEELIRDSPLSPFPCTMNTERPDKFAAALLEGHVGILTDNTPFALIVPVTFWQLLQATGDYYHNFWAGTTMRWVRLFALLVALTLPAMYTILITFHHEMIPTPLALSIAGGREGTPLPTLAEVVLMAIMFEVIQEAGLRLPRAVGQTVSIVGALVIGEAAVQAGLVSPGTVIVIATAGLTGFAIPSFPVSLTIRLVRFALLVLSGVLGVFGLVGGTAFLIWHMASLRSFGAPYLGPLAPLQFPELRDTLVRAPRWAMLRRPRMGQEPRTRRQPVGQMPRPPGRNGSR